MDYTYVYVVTYWDEGEEPVVTVFNNEEAAKKCCEYFKAEHFGCCVDEVPIYSKFGTD